MHIATLLVLDDVAVRQQLTEGFAIVNVLEQCVDLLRKVAVYNVGSLVSALSVKYGGFGVAVGLIARNLS